MRKRNVEKAIQNGFRKLGLDIRRTPQGIYDQDGLTSVHGHSFMEDPAFSEAYKYAFDATKADPDHHGPWRVHIAMWAAKTALRRDGDFVECGTARAFVTTAVLKYTNWNEASGGRNFYLVDTFEGIVDELLTDAERALGAIPRHGDRYRNNYPDALRNVSPFNNVHLIKGIVPNILPNVPAQKISYLHLDMNSAVAEVAAFRHFWPKIVTGGVILFDDFVYLGYEPQTLALSEVAREFGVEIAQLPSGQGLLIK